MTWRNRITGHGEEAPDQLLANPLNFRKHPERQQKALSQALEKLGVIQSVIVNQRTGNLIDGHLRVTLALRENKPSIPVVYVDLSQEEEALALATLDPITEMATTDTAALRDLLTTFDSAGDSLDAMFRDMLKTPDPKGQAEPEARTCPHCGETL